MKVRAYLEGDLEKIELQDAQLGALDAYEQIDLTGLSEQGLAYTAEVDGRVIGIGGLSPYWPGRSVAWALLSKDAGSHFRSLHREVQRRLAICGIVRIEATCDIGFKQGHRWLKMLGFDVECHMAAYRPDGGDQILYARVRR